ncbi:efflux RND transporter permease subunit [Cellulosilyticum ruminicola]|uniref:efflux RND transporter permease subunit n=1 Tax=Cellulosilyticum ruminicola TaxID=425254 RepID=UPI0006D0AEE7|nr:MMPL family transporter [Cellulosilyticum ruminicola]
MKEEKKSFMEQMATLIVDKRKGLFLAFVIAIIFCAIASTWVHVDNDITDYLPDATQTRQGLTIMDDEFITYGSAKIMVDNVSYEKAKQIADSLVIIDGVKSVEFDDTSAHYKEASALFNVTFNGEETDTISVEAMNKVKEKLAAYDTYISSAVGAGKAELIQNEMNTVMVIVAIIILVVLLFTSQTYMEVPVLIITFGVAAILNKGTNFLLGEISFVSDSIAVVLQLALAIDYAIILCHRYTEEREHLEAREAVIMALSKAIPEISSSSLTTISGMGALMFMQFKLGFDLGSVLIKAILFSLLSVFTLMPGLLMLFSPWIDKTHHKNFVPNITIWGKLSMKLHFILPPIFIIFLVGSFFISNRCHYVYGYSTLTTIKRNNTQISEEKIRNTFGDDNLLVVMVPAGNYDVEERMIREMEQLDFVDSVQALANTEAMDGYILTEGLTPRQFAEITDLDIEVANVLYSAYAAKDDNYGKIVAGIDHYSVPLIDMFGFLYEEKQEGYITLEGDMAEELEDINEQLTDAKLQLKGKNYSRILLHTNLDEEGEVTFSKIDKLHEIINQYYERGGFVIGDSTSDYDLSSSFTRDNMIINILSALFITIILIFTFQSAGLPILLMAIIEGSIWMNFSEPVIVGKNMFFLSYLIVSSIQMGANIDYAIVITTRYQELKRMMPRKEAIIESLNQCFPTIITSGCILAAAGVFIGFLSSEEAISSIGLCLGRGTIISIILVMSVLPQLLVLGDFIIEKTAFTINLPDHGRGLKGNFAMDGYVKGYVSGMIDGDFKGTIQGTLSAAVEGEKKEGTENEKTK